MSEHKIPDFFQPDTSEVRLNRMWGRISSRRSRGAQWRWAVVGAMATAACVLIVVSMKGRTPVYPLGSELTASATLDDGSQVELQPGSTAQVAAIEPELTRIRLTGGRATFEVTKKPSRRFEVVAQAVTVRVVGTRFHVAMENGGVDVEVDRGIVEVEGGGETVRLTTGMRWSSVKHVEAAQAAEAAAEEDDEPAPAGAPQPPAKKKRPRKIAAPVAVPAPAAPEVPAAGGAPATASPGPSELFKAALEARRSGRPAAAAESLEQFLKVFPTDSRASLAAFELGRLRMDSLHDTAGAAEALRRSLKGATAEFREEALARLVRAYDALGKKSECAEMKAEYLSNYPQGSYLQSVSNRCSSP